MQNITCSSADVGKSRLTNPDIWKESIMNTSREILRSIAKEPSVFPIAIPWKDKPLRSVLPLACRVGS
jgi:hypothetical protein